MRKMKDTIYPWLGKIPVSWNTSKLLYCLRQQICDGPHETPNVIDDGIPFISIDSLNESKHVDLSIVKKFISEEDYLIYRQKTNLEKGDILFSKSATIGKTAIVGDEVFMVWSPLAIIKSKVDSIQNEYLYYLLNCDELIASIRLSGSFNTQANVGMREMERAVIPVPPLDEQKIVAQFLDSKCAEIDALFADIQSEIETLEVYKRSVIAEAVTKGLDKNAPTKESGIEWAPRIPESWNVKKAKYNFKNHKYIPGAKSAEYDRLALTLNGVIHRSKDDADGLQPKDFLTYQLLRKGELVFKLIDLQNISTSRVGLAHDIGLVSPAYIILHATGDVLPEFAEKYFLMLWHREIFNALGDNGVRSNLNSTDLLSIPICYPSVSEQKRIVDFLDSKCDEIDAIIAQRQEQLAVLADYKKSIIYEYVTGKKEVPVA